MQFETALNLVWAVVGVAALAVAGISEVRRRAATLRSRCRRVIAVLVATVALFPCISASDDLVCLETLQPGTAARAEYAGPQSSIPRSAPRIYLALRLEVIGNFQISVARSFLTTLFASSTVAPAAVQCSDRPLPSHPGRAPPRLSILG
ncbi:MAG TPA: hypothetical protein VG028_09005 [Terriglobia bacterium]|nr:hypothetical protein [Terriglobia bacterium]